MTSIFNSTVNNYVIWLLCYIIFLSFYRGEFCILGESSHLLALMLWHIRLTSVSLKEAPQLQPSLKEALGHHVQHPALTSAYFPTNSIISMLMSLICKQSLGHSHSYPSWRFLCQYIILRQALITNSPVFPIYCAKSPSHFTEHFSWTSFNFQTQGFFERKTNLSQPQK